MTVTTHDLPMILDEVAVRSVERLSPSFVRVELGADSLAEFGVDGPLLDQRVKLVFPNASGELASFAGVDASWRTTWLDLPVEERGHMRTYTVREVRGSGTDTRLVVDFVLHLAEGATGPGSAWAAQAAPGDRLVLLAPRRGFPFGGIEFDPGAASRLLLVGDETAVPAICSILEDLPPDARGTVLLEVPQPADVVGVRMPAGMDLVWLPRSGEDPGERVVPAVREYVGLGDAARPGPDLVEPASVDPDLWETPTYSSSGEVVASVVPEPREHEGLLADTYAWIAGESRMVTTLRRCLVSELGMDRRRVAFMGYWRRGVAMRS